MCATNLLLPGEDPRAYEAHLEGTFRALAPGNDAEAKVVALVADDLWKLDRVGRMEKALILGRAEYALVETEVGQRAAGVRDALVVLGGALEGWRTLPPDVLVTQDLLALIERLHQAIEAANILVPGISEPLQQGALVALTLCEGAEVGARLSGEHLRSVGNEAAKLMHHLLLVGEAADAEQQELRATIARSILPDAKEFKLLARYSKAIEEGLTRRLQVLEQLRALSKGTVPAAQPGAHGYSVNLRLVGQGARETPVPRDFPKQ